MQNQQSAISLGWLARLFSVAVGCAFLAIVVLSIFNEDKPQAPAIPVLLFVVLAVAASLAAWRWEKIGGLLVILCALCLMAAVYSASVAFGLASNIILFISLYCAPFLVVGLLFWLSGTQREQQQRMA